MNAVKLILKALLATFFILAGINHFRSPEFYLNIMPDYVPAHELMVQLSGVTEIVAGIMLLIPGLSRWGAWFIIAHLVVFFTVHFWMIQHAADRYAEVPLAVLWARIPLQVIFIVWAMWYINDGKPDDMVRKNAQT